MASKSKSSSGKTKPSSIVPFSGAVPKSLEKSLPSMEKIMSSSKQNFEKIKSDTTASSRQGMEACMKSGNLMKQGVEQYFKTVVGLAQASAERQSEAFKQLLSCKTLNEVTEAQNKIAQDNFEEMMQAATKLSEIGIKLATEVFEPINAEVSKTVKKATESYAA